MPPKNGMKKSRCYGQNKEIARARANGVNVPRTELPLPLPTAETVAEALVKAEEHGNIIYYTEPDGIYIKNSNVSLLNCSCSFKLNGAERIVAEL